MVLYAYENFLLSSLVYCIINLSRVKITLDIYISQIVILYLRRHLYCPANLSQYIHIILYYTRAYSHKIITYGFSRTSEVCSHSADTSQPQQPHSAPDSDGVSVDWNWCESSLIHAVHQRACCSSLQPR